MAIVSIYTKTISNCTEITTARLKLQYIIVVRKNKMKKVVKQFFALLTLLWMIVILGTQALLKGSWTSENRDQTTV